MSIFKDLLNNARSDEPEKEPTPAPEVKPDPKPEIIVSSKNREGKRSHPDYRQTTVYVRKDLHRKLTRILEDSGYNGDFSDWIEKQMLTEIAKNKPE